MPLEMMKGEGFNAKVYLLNMAIDIICMIREVIYLTGRLTANENAWFVGQLL